MDLGRGGPTWCSSSSSRGASWAQRRSLLPAAPCLLRPASSPRTRVALAQRRWSRLRSSPYRLAVDVPWAAVGTLAWGLPELLESRIAPARCRWCDRDGAGGDTLDALDRAGRDALGWDSTTAAGRLSDVTAYLLAPAAVVGLHGWAAWSQGEPPLRRALEDSLVVAKATATAAVLAQVVKLSVARARPFAHAAALADPTLTSSAGGGTTARSILATSTSPSPWRWPRPISGWRRLSIASRTCSWGRPRGRWWALPFPTDSTGAPRRPSSASPGSSRVGSRRRGGAGVDPLAGRSVVARTAAAQRSNRLRTVPVRGVEVRDSGATLSVRWSRAAVAVSTAARSRRAPSGTCRYSWERAKQNHSQIAAVLELDVHMREPVPGRDQRLTGALAEESRHGRWPRGPRRDARPRHSRRVHAPPRRRAPGQRRGEAPWQPPAPSGPGSGSATAAPAAQPGPAAPFPGSPPAFRPTARRPGARGCRRETPRVC